MTGRQNNRHGSYTLFKISLVNRRRNEPPKKSLQTKNTSSIYSEIDIWAKRKMFFFFQSNQWYRNGNNHKPLNFDSSIVS